ncbi:hypothetical protein CBL_04284 [Carabus blaptoides fortunei]
MSTAAARVNWEFIQNRSVSGIPSFANAFEQVDNGLLRVLMSTKPKDIKILPPYHCGRLHESRAFALLISRAVLTSLGVGRHYRQYNRFAMNTLIKDNRRNYAIGVLFIIKPRKSYDIKVCREFDFLLTAIPEAASGKLFLMVQQQQPIAQRAKVDPEGLLSFLCLPRQDSLRSVLCDVNPWGTSLTHATIRSFVHVGVRATACSDLSRGSAKYVA